jgi:hypothetical protein
MCLSNRIPAVLFAAVELLTAPSAPAQCPGGVCPTYPGYYAPPARFAPAFFLQQPLQAAAWEKKTTVETVRIGGLRDDGNSYLYLVTPDREEIAAFFPDYCKLSIDGKPADLKSVKAWIKSRQPVREGVPCPLYATVTTETPSYVGVVAVDFSATAPKAVKAK